MNNEQLLQHVADRIRTQYIVYRRIYEQQVLNCKESYYVPGPHWDGGRDRSGRICKNIWIEIAKFVLANKLDPDRLVQIVFATTPSGKSPMPNQLLGPAALDRYFRAEAEHKDGLEETLQVALGTQKELYKHSVQDLLESGWDAVKAKQDVLLDETIMLSMLFRYCMAYRLGFKNICERYEIGAEQQYNTAVETYNQIWKQLIPETLRRAATDKQNLLRSHYA